MGEGDFMPTGHRRKKADPKRAKKIKEGGKKADQIHKQTEKHHKEFEVPAADEALLKDLEGINNSKS